MLTLLQGLALAGLSSRQAGRGGATGDSYLLAFGASHQDRREAVACLMRPPQARLAQKAEAGFPTAPRPHGPVSGPSLSGDLGP